MDCSSVEQVIDVTTAEPIQVSVSSTGQSSATPAVQSSPSVISLESSAPNMPPQLVIPAPSTNVRRPQAKLPKTKKQNSPPITPEETEIEYLKVELSNARTEIVKLDSEIETYKKKLLY